MAQLMRPLATGPLARDTELTKERLFSETIIYDHQRHRVHCLNRVLAFVLEQCDGHTPVHVMAERLLDAMNLPPDQDIILLALRQLKRIHLLTGEIPELSSKDLPSRRELGRRLAYWGGVMLPAVASIAAPTPAMAQSADTHGNGEGNGNGNGSGEQGENGHGHRNS